MKKFPSLTMYIFVFFFSVLSVTLYFAISDLPYSLGDLQPLPNHSYFEPSIHFLVNNIGDGFTVGFPIALTFVLPVLIIVYGAQYYYPSTSYGSLSIRLLIIGIGSLIVSMVSSVGSILYIPPQSYAALIVVIDMMNYGPFLAFFFKLPAMIVLVLIVAWIAHAGMQKPFLKSVAKAAPGLLMLTFIGHVSLLAVDYHSCGRLQYSGISKLHNEICVAKKAITNDDPTYCERLTSNDYECYLHVAVKNRNPLVCQKIKGVYALHKGETGLISKCELLVSQSSE